MNKNSKGFAQFLVLIITAIFIIGGIGYYAFKNGQIRINQPTEKTIEISNSSPAQPPTPTLNTENWKTYINSKYHYTLKYTDPTFTLTRRSCTAGKPALLEGEDIFVILPITTAIVMKACYPLEWVADIQIEVVPGDKTTPVSSSWEKLTIDNIPGYKIKTHFPESEVGGPTELTEARVYHNKFTYIVYLGNPESEKIFDQILFTFKFLD